MDSSVQAALEALQIYDEIGIPLPRMLVLGLAMAYAGGAIGAAIVPSVPVPPGPKALRKPPALSSERLALLPSVMAGQSLGSDEPYRDLSAFEQPVFAEHRDPELAVRAASGMAVMHDAVGHAAVTLAFCCTAWDMGPVDTLMRLKPMMRELSDRSEEAWLVRARWYVATQQLKEATDILDNTDPQHRESHRVRASLALLRGSWDEAATHYLHAATLSSAPLSGPFYARAAVLQASLGDFAGGIISAQRALERYPPDANSRQLLSVALRRRLRWGEAMRVALRR